MVAAVVEERGARRVVVGLPLSLDGRRGPAAAGRRRPTPTSWPGLLAPHGVAVETFDERLTTVSAARSLRRGRPRGEASARRIDQSAAAVLLQAWLDTGRGRDDA